MSCILPSLTIAEGSYTRISNKMSICDTCGNCISQALQDPDRRVKPFLHHKTVEDLNAAVARGCQICNYILRTERFWTSRTAGLNILRGEHQPDCQLLLVVLGGHRFSVTLACRCHKRSKPPILSFSWKESKDLQAIRHVVGSTSGSSESMFKVQGWVSKCQATHALCARLQTPVWYPSRLLDLEAESPQRSPTTRLVLTAEQSISGPYNTLSHCWGSEPFLCLSKETIVQFREELPVSRLTKTFQEAIDFTRRLGVRYLWIDSLCIVQDRIDPSDWLHESQFMHQIYENGYINLCATASRNGKQGLYRARDPLLVGPCVIKHITGDLEGYIELEPHDDVIASIEKYSPLHERAWTHQERLISPRSLHFTERELIWECRQHFASEKHPDGVPSPSAQRFDLFRGPLRMSTKTAGTTYLKASALRHPEAKHREIDVLEDLHRWHKLREKNAGAHLTFSDDRVLAISGIAKIFEPLVDDVYAAGMWRKRLNNELLWFVPRGTSQLAQIHRKYYTPSFSWTSVSGPVSGGDSLSDDELEPCMANVLSLDLQYLTEDHTGHIKSAELRIQGRLHRIKIQRNSGKLLTYDNDTDLKASYYLDYTKENLPESSEGKQHFVILFYHNEYSGYDGLVLELLEKRTKRHRRIGKVDRLLDIEVLERQQGRAEYPCESYDSETDKHIVCIV